MWDKFLRRRPQVTQRSAQDPIAFTHIPKCAGTALVQALAQHLHPKASLIGIHDHVLFGDFDAFDTMGDAQRRSVFAPDQPLPRDFAFVAGHLAVSTTTKAYPDARRITIVREGRARILSHWLFWRRHSDEALAPWGAVWSERVKRSRKSLTSFLADPQLACQTDNLVARMLLWPDARLPAAGFIESFHDNALVEASVACLKTFDFVSFIENPLLSTLLSDYLGIPFSLQHANTGSRVPPEFEVVLEEELTPEAKALLEDRSRLDNRIWSEVVRMGGAGASIEACKALAWRASFERHRSIQAA